MDYYDAGTENVQSNVSNQEPKSRPKVLGCFGCFRGKDHENRCDDGDSYGVGEQKITQTETELSLRESNDGIAGPSHRLEEKEENEGTCPRVILTFRTFSHRVRFFRFSRLLRWPGNFSNQ